MSQRPIAVFDSGIGGLPYVKWLKSHLPHEQWVYVADAAHFPYGEKSEDEVKDIVVNLALEIVQRRDPKLLLVACNTASVLALDRLRETLRLPIVGVVPAVKTAAGLGTRTVGVLATPRTVGDGYWERLVRDYAPGRVVKGYAAPDLVRIVEEDRVGPERTQALERWAKTLSNDDVDVVVLGCTHYLHLDGELAALLGDDVSIVDNRDGVGRRVQQVLSQEGLLAESCSGPSELWYTADNAWTEAQRRDVDARFARWSERFSLEHRGPWGQGS